MNIHIISSRNLNHYTYRVWYEVNGEYLIPLDVTHYPDGDLGYDNGNQSFFEKEDFWRINLRREDWHDEALVMALNDAISRL